MKKVVVGCMGVFLIYDWLNAQINLGIRMQQVYKLLGGKTASETIVGWTASKKKITGS